MIRIVTLCGMGFGSSLTLKMAIDKILSANGIKAEIVAWDLGSFKGQSADIVVAPSDMKKHLESYQGKVVLVNNLIDQKEIESKVLPVVREMLSSK